MQPYQESHSRYSNAIVSGNPDVIFNANPNEGSHVGWIYTLESSWRRYGNMVSGDLNIGTFDALGIGTNNPRNCTLKVGSGQTSMC